MWHMNSSSDTNLGNGKGLMRRGQRLEMNTHFTEQEQLMNW